MYLDSPIGGPHHMNFLPTALEWYGRDNCKGYGNDTKSGTDMRVWYNYEGYVTDMSGSGQI